MRPSRPLRGSGHPGVEVDRNPGAVQRIPPDEPEPLDVRLRGLAWQVAWEAVRRVPEPVAFGAAAVAAPIMRLVAVRQRHQLRANLARVLPAASPTELDALVAAGFRSYTRYFVEAFRAADLRAEDVAARTTTAGTERLDAALERGRGAVILLAHHGTWDVAAAWGEAHAYHLAVVAEVVRPRALFEKFVRLRETIGLEVVPLRRGESLIGRLSTVLAANHLVGLLSDRDLTGKGPIVELFGEPARIPPGPVLLARRTGAAVLPATMLQRPGRRWHLEILPELDVTSGTVEDGCAVVARGIEAIVRTDPTQWHVLSSVWLADVPPHRRGDVPPDIAERLESGWRSSGVEP